MPVYNKNARMLALRGVLLCAWVVLMTVHRAAAQETAVEVVIDCCTVLKALYRYMAVDDKYEPCTDVGCSSLRLIQLFLNHTATTLAPTMHGVQSRGSDLVFRVPTGQGLAPLLVFAFFGRSVSPADEQDMELWLSYDTTVNRVRFEDSTCDFNKNVYTALVLCSIVLLMFFIAVQVVKDTEHESKEQVTDAKQATHQPSKVTAAVGFPDAKAHVPSSRDARLVLRTVQHPANLKLLV
jgi:hypothetical protein